MCAPLEFMQYKESVALGERVQHGVFIRSNSHQPSSYLSLHFSHDNTTLPTQASSGAKVYTGEIPHWRSQSHCWLA